MQVEPQAVPGRFTPGMNSRKRKQLKIAAKFDELVAEYFPNGGHSVTDGNRLRLAAAHYIDADLCRDPVVRQRATRCAELLVSKLRRQEGPSPTLAEMLAEIGK